MYQLSSAGNVYVHGYTDMFVESHGGGPVENYVHLVDQFVPAAQAQSETRQTAVTGYPGNFVIVLGHFILQPLEQLKYICSALKSIVTTRCTFIF